jgi:thiol-disulfide isomerase/thioredoxin
MVSVVDVISTYIRPYSKTILIVASVLFFAIAAYYFYDKWNIPRANKYQDIYQPNDNGQNEAVIYFFFADWCPHCTKAKPEWTEFANSYDGKMIKGIKLRCSAMDCSDPDVPETAAKIDQYGITSYPTIKLIVKDTTYDFDASVTKEHLEQFVNSVIV